MVKIIELIVILALLIFSFFTGVKYSDQVKEKASWLFENKEDIELPEIKNGEIPYQEEQNNEYQSPQEQPVYNAPEPANQPTTDSIEEGSITSEEEESAGSAPAVTNPPPAPVTTPNPKE